jgi:fluoroacetyl-CoA thioesterase
MTGHPDASLIPLGLTHSERIAVDPSLTVPAMSGSFAGFVDMPPVFATAFMVGFVEWTCVEALRPYVAGSWRTVGTLIEMSHVAATPVGMTVTAEVELVAASGRMLRFRVACRDEAGPIGAGMHERALVELDRFMARANGRRAGPDAV